MFVLTGIVPYKLDNGMIRQLVAELPAPRLASVTNLELTWEVTKPPGFKLKNKYYRWPQTPDQFPFELLQSALPALRKLHVSLDGELVNIEEWLMRDLMSTGSEWIKKFVKVREDVVFGAADAFARGFTGSRLEELYISIPWTLWECLRRKYHRIEKAAFVAEGLSYPGLRFWRAIEGASESCVKGYWVVTGNEGGPPQPLIATLH
ncbi:hypothetical protein MMYC01_208652 [Madurella mycetomatis]|uniref:Uncharacterized protein n=1 Tax=Madurella mycetomatis TaxID=100816 RepID=A0A175VRY4_9PEZI|nr:hypothetical protein MMYC01_209790 [Madurella mycetomatis]KXX74811.1 hypothetical protein MMYC01_208652 [Madurella mycetomatis]